MTNEQRGLLLACGFAIVTLGLCGRISEGEGQRRPTAERIHAAACVGEVGWAAPDDACASIVESHVRRAASSSLSPEGMALAFSKALRDPPADRRWVPELMLVTPRRAPRSWPARLPWAPWRVAALERYEQVAAQVLSGERIEVCPGCVNYGSREDAQPPGTEEVRRFVLSERPRREQVFYRLASPPGDG